MKYELSIIIPVFNESKTILEILSRLFNTVSLQKLKIQFIVVDDGSSDDTAYKIKNSKFWNHKDFLFFFHEKNKGKSSAIRTAIPHLSSDYTIIQDGDLEYHPEDIATLFQKAKTKNLQVVYGSRNLQSKNKRGGFFFFWGGRFLTMVTNLLYRQKLTDMPTCYKLIETKLLQSLPLCSRRFEFCPEVTALIAKQGIQIEEYPIQYSPRGKSEGKKINWRDGLVALFVLCKLRLIPMKRMIFLGVLFLCVFSVYLCTWNAQFVGYEKETADTALGFLKGDYLVRRAGVAAALLYIPFLLFEKLFSFSSVSFLTLVPIFYSACTIVFLFLIAEKIIQKTHIALLFSLVIAVGSIVWPYSVMGMEYQMMFFLTALLAALIVWQKNIERPMISGIIFGILCVTKSYGVLIGIPYLLFIYLTLKKQNKVSLLYSASFLLKALFPAIFLFGSTLLVNLFLYGSISGVYSLMHEFQIKNIWEGFYGVFFSIGKSIFFFNPLLLLSCLYWKKFYVEYKEISVFILTSFILLLCITAPFIYWSDETWGVRKLVPILPLLHLPLFYYLTDLQKWSRKIIFILFLFVSVYVQFLGASYNYSSQLSFLRTVEMDSLTSMRYIPEFSHIVLYHNFFMSYVERHLYHASLYFSYEDVSWFRWLKAGDHDIAFKNIHVSLEAFEQPRIFWFHHVTSLKKIFFSIVCIFVLSSFFFLLKYYRKGCSESSDDV